VILKSLEKDRDSRFASAGEMAEALLAIYQPEGLDNGQPASRSGETPTQDAVPETLEAGKIETTHSEPLTPNVRILLADDHGLTRQSLAYFLDDIQGFQVVGQASDGQEAYDKIAEANPDVILLDLNMPGTSGMAILPRIRAEYPDVKVLVLTGRDENSYIMEALRAGANGYVLKTSSEDDLANSVREVTTGRLILGRGVAERVVEYLMQRETEDQPLSGTEQDILTCVAAGMDNPVIAEKLGITDADVARNLMSIIDRLKVTNKTEAALMALRAGWINLNELHKFS
jgi:DNA-binding NarL/FixJ family response regulator